MKAWIRKRLKWKILFMSLLVNMLAIGIATMLLPGFNLPESSLLGVMAMAAFLGLLNTFVKPILQVLTIRLLFMSYGLVLILTNTVVLLLLGWLFPSGLEIRGPVSAILGGTLIALTSIFLDYAFGVIPPLGYQTHVGT